MHGHRRLPCLRIAMLAAILFAGAATPAPARAAPLTADQQEEISRITVGLLVRQQPPALVATVMIEFTLCVKISVEGKSHDCFDAAAKKLGMFTFEFVEAGGIVGHWRVYDGYKKRWGTLEIFRQPDQHGSYLRGDLDAGGDTVRFTLYRSPGNPDFYDIYYSTNDDHGEGFVQWLHGGCRMQGLFVSDQNMDPNTGRPITSYLVFRRC